VEVKIGVSDTVRELVLNSTQTPDEVESLVADAFKNPSGTLALTDDKGRRYVVAAAKVAYVEIGGADARKVGFAP
jgi:hypothetical protein